MTRDDHFDEFAAHTRLKHLILESYFIVWARKLLLRPDAGDTIYYIDACAGRGMDDAGNHGSPIIAAREAAKVQGQLADARHNKRVNVKVVAIEKRPRHYAALRDNLRPFAGADVRRGTLGEHFDALEAEMRGAPALVFIDPFGIEPLRADVVRRALRRDRTEILALFADQAALRHFGLVSADEIARGEVEYRDIGLFERTEEDNAREAADLRAREEARRPTKEACREIMDAAFGDASWYEAMITVPARERRRRVLDLYENLLHEQGAGYVLRIPIRDANDRHVYHLFHVTKSVAGYVAMKEAVDHALKAGHLPQRTSETIRFMTGGSATSIELRVRSKFAGQTVRWTVDPQNPRAPSIYRFIMEETPALPSQAMQVRDALKPLKQPGRTFVYRFPD